ncbi:MAG: hypothetical protein EXR75_08150 [Myxococcales bacterium]|nr:hypothetical protein [Myxococcales bacterium]
MKDDERASSSAVNKLGVVGLGQCGGNLAALFAARGYPAVALNVSASDLATHKLAHYAKFRLPEDVSGWGDPIASAASYLGEVELLLVIGGLGGSVGGSLGELVRKLHFMGVPVIAAGVMPGKTDSFGAKRTAFAALNDLVDGPFESLILIDNQKLHALHSGLGVDHYLPACNGSVLDAFDRIYHAGDMPGLVPIRSFEQRAFRGALAGGGVTVFGEKEIDGPLTHESLLQACIEIVNNNPLLASEHDLEDIVTLGSVVVASEDLLERTPIAVFDKYHTETHLVTGGIAHDVGIYRGGSGKPRLHIVASGLGLPSSVQRMLDELGEDAKRVEAKRMRVRAKLQRLDLSSLPEVEGGVGPRSVRTAARVRGAAISTRSTPMRPPKPESKTQLHTARDERAAVLAAETAETYVHVDNPGLRQAFATHQTLATPGPLPSPNLPRFGLPAAAAVASNAVATTAIATNAATPVPTTVSASATVARPASIPPPLPGSASTRTSTPPVAPTPPIASAVRPASTPPIASARARVSVPPPLPQSLPAAAEAAPTRLESPSEPASQVPPTPESSTASGQPDANPPVATSSSAPAPEITPDPEPDSSPEIAFRAAEADIEEASDEGAEHLDKGDIDEVDRSPDAAVARLPRHKPPRRALAPAARAAFLVPDAPLDSPGVGGLPSFESTRSIFESVTHDATPVSPSMVALTPPDEAAYKKTSTRAAPNEEHAEFHDAPGGSDDDAKVNDRGATVTVGSFSTSDPNTVTLSESAAAGGRLKIVVELDPEDDLGVGTD